MFQLWFCTLVCGKMLLSGTASIQGGKPLQAEEKRALYLVWSSGNEMDDVSSLHLSLYAVQLRQLIVLLDFFFYLWQHSV